MPPGKIYDINAYSISTAVIESGGKPVYFGVVPDDKAALTKAMQTAVGFCGYGDYFWRCLGWSTGLHAANRGFVGKAGIVVYGIAVKPGKPTTVGFIGDKPVFSSAWSSDVCFADFLFACETLIQRLAGRPVAA